MSTTNNSLAVENSQWGVLRYYRVMHPSDCSIKCDVLNIVNKIFVFLKPTGNWSDTKKWVLFFIGRFSRSSMTWLLASSGTIQTRKKTSNMEGLVKSGRSFSNIEGCAKEQLQRRRKSSNIDERCREDFLKCGKLLMRRRSSNVENGAQEELRLQMRRRSSIVDTPPWGEIWNWNSLPYQLFAQIQGWLLRTWKKLLYLEKSGRIFNCSIKVNF